jgi:hypothetical protein
MQLAFLREHHQALLVEGLGDKARLAPLPQSARRPGRDW